MFKPFNPETDLPRWALKYPEVVYMAERNLAYRCDVWRARRGAGAAQWRRYLIRMARRFFDGHGR